MAAAVSPRLPDGKHSACAAGLARPEMEGYLNGGGRVPAFARWQPPGLRGLIGTARKWDNTGFKRLCPDLFRR